MLQAQLDRSKLIESGRHGATRLIPKVDTVPDVTQLRPITLLQVDYRLLSKCLAVRLHAVIGEVVGPGQLGTGNSNILTGVYNILSSIDYVNKHNLPAYIASWDAMKAYDRSSIVYLDKVTERMAFPPVFRGWLRMLHERATTRLILPTGLSREITVSFSFRQGDSIAGDLFCLNQEPLLRQLRKLIVGLKVSNFNQKDEDYMDDIQFLSSNKEDLVTFNRVFRQYEAQSGAMLSRDQKSKVMGLGQWQGNHVWPLNWIQSVDVMKVLGFQVCPQYSDTLRCTWEAVFKGFQRRLFSWENRMLNTLQQRVAVAQTFALSKLWYVAQVLPLPQAVLKKIESSLSSFIFKGRHERLKLEEIENTVKEGGLGLTCVATKAECLLLRQSLRILARTEENCFRHAGYWLGHALEEPFPQLKIMGPVNTQTDPRFPLHQTMLLVLQEGLWRQEYDPSKLNEASTKKIYEGRAAYVIPPPKIQEKYPHVDFPALVYPRLCYNILEGESKDTLFSLVNNIFYNKERMFQQGRLQDPSCQLPECQGRIQDREHIFTSCFLVAEAWVWLRSRLLRLLPTTVGAAGISSEDFLLLQFPMDTMDKECVWLIGNYCDIVNNSVTGRRCKLGSDKLAGRLRARLTRLRNRAVVQPQLYNIKKKK